MSKKNKAPQTAIISNSTKKEIPVNQEISSPKDNPRLWFWVCVAVLSISVIVAFSGGFDNKFVDWDDNAYVTENKMVLKPEGNWGKAWNTHIAANYHPLTMLSLMINSSLFGTESARSFIITNTLIHLLNVLLVFWFVLLLLKKKDKVELPTTGKPLFVAFFTALVFAIHPLKVESVIWVSERKDVLYGFFFLLGCISYLKYLGSDLKYKYLTYSFLLLILACLSKGQAVVLPIVFILLDYWYDRKFDKEAIIEKIPFLMISLLFGIIASNIQGGGDFYGLINGKFELTAISAINTKHDLWSGVKYACYGFSQYFINFFFPHNLSSFYPVGLNGETRAPNYGFGIVFTLIAIAGTIASFKWSKPVFFGIAFFVISFVLVSQLLLVGGAIKADRYTYLPYIGLAFLVFYLLSNVVEKGVFQRYAVLGISGIFMIFFLIKTRGQVEVWENSRTLMNQRVELYPKDARAHFVLGKYAGEKEDNYDLCIEEYLKCIENEDSTKIVEVYGNIATAYAKKLDYPNAIKYYSISITKEPKNGLHYMNRGFQYLKTQQPEKALPDLEKAVKLPMKKEDRASIFGGLGTAQLNVGLVKESYQNFNTAIDKEGSKDAIHFFNRGVARLKLFNDKEGAIADVRKSLEINPNYAEAKNGLKVLGVAN
jgi:protein O-mannosyl-transferase